MKLHEAIGLELERREKVMTFEEWIQKWRDAQPDGKLPHELEEGAEEAWDYQQARIEALEKAAREVVGFYAMNSQHPSEAVDALAALLEAEK